MACRRRSVVRRQDARMRVQRRAAEKARLPDGDGGAGLRRGGAAQPGAAVHAAFGGGAGAAPKLEPCHSQGARRRARHGRLRDQGSHRARSARFGHAMASQAVYDQARRRRESRLQRDHFCGHARSRADRTDRRVHAHDTRIGGDESRRVRDLLPSNTSSCCASTGRTASWANGSR